MADMLTMACIKQGACSPIAGGMPAPPHHGECRTPLCFAAIAKWFHDSSAALGSGDIWEASRPLFSSVPEPPRTRKISIIPLLYQVTYFAFLTYSTYSQSGLANYLSNLSGTPFLYSLVNHGYETPSAEAHTDTTHSREIDSLLG